MPIPTAIARRIPEDLVRAKSPDVTDKELEKLMESPVAEAAALAANRLRARRNTAS